MQENSNDPRRDPAPPVVMGVRNGSDNDRYLRTLEIPGLHMQVNLPGPFMKQPVPLKNLGVEFVSNDCNIHRPD